ncbi:MAG TPA: MarR family transcriptional regulator [Rhodothermales bacterium]|nr:MarR family transcriptional regulator [Rhodothermales bacterium]
MNDVARDFIERMGLMAERDGMFSRIAGRMLGFFMLDGKPHSLDDIAEQLQISKASASTNARFLEQMGVLERCSSFGDRRDFYRLGDSPWEDLFDVARHRMENVLRLVDNTASLLPDEMDIARKRLQVWREFYAFMLDEMDAQAERWRQRLARTSAVEAGSLPAAISERD